MRKSTVEFGDLRHRLSLDWFFQTHLHSKPKPTVGGNRYGTCPACGESSRGDNSVKVSVRGAKWRCFSCEESGDILDAAKRYWGVGANEAASMLVENETATPMEKLQPVQVKEVVRDYASIKLAITKLIDAQEDPDENVVNYLVETRKISRFIVHNACVRELIITLPGTPEGAFEYLKDVLGKDLMVKAQMWKEGSRYPALAYRPLAFVSRDLSSIEFRTIGQTRVDTAKALRYGDPLPWLWKGSKNLFITEGCIDLLSAVSLGIEDTIMALPGANNWSESIFGEMDGYTVTLALDNDKSGQSGNQKLRELLVGKGAKVKNFDIPKDFKDLNEMLVGKA